MLCGRGCRTCPPSSTAGGGRLGSACSPDFVDAELAFVCILSAGSGELSTLRAGGWARTRPPAAARTEALAGSVKGAAGAGGRAAPRAARLGAPGSSACGLLAPLACRFLVAAAYGLRAECGSLARPFPRARARAGGACAGALRGRGHPPALARRPVSYACRPSTHAGDGSRAPATPASRRAGSAAGARSSVVGSPAGRAVPAAATRPGSHGRRSPAEGRRRAGRPAVPRLPIAPGARAPGRRLPAARPCPLKGAGAALRPALRRPGGPAVRC
jgi:hypothetical protein